MLVRRWVSVNTGAFRFLSANLLRPAYRGRYALFFKISATRGAK